MPSANSRKTIRVMLIDSQPKRLEELDAALRQVGCELVAAIDGEENLLAKVKQKRPDVILIDIDLPGRDTLESLEKIQSQAPKPLIVFSQDDDQQTIQRAMEVGVSAYIVDGLQLSRVRSIIDVAIARFDHFNKLEKELEKTQRQLSERKKIDQAKGILMKQRNLSEEQAYNLMRKSAMGSNRKISQVAESIIDAASLLID